MDFAEERPAMSEMNTALDPDLIDTAPICKLAVLRADAKAAIAARDAIDDCFSTEWRDAHAAAVLACSLAADEMERLAKNPKTRYGSWRTPSDVELMTLGYL
jgi:hypothetical protein